MARVIPKTVSQQIEFFQQRAPVWVTNAVSLGLTGDKALAVQDAADGAAAAQTGVEVAEQALKNAYLDRAAAMGELLSIGQSAVRDIKMKIEVTGNPALYMLAQIPPPEERLPRPTPEQPVALSGSLDSSGAVTLRWICPGVRIFFRVLRRLDSESAWTLVGASGKRSFVDADVPISATVAQYRIVATRGDLESPPSEPVSVGFAAMAA